MGKSLRIVGVMTGTSCDGLDAACIDVRVTGGEPELGRRLWAARAPYPARLRERVLDAQRAGTKLSIREWLRLDADVGEWLGQAMARALRGRAAPAVIAAHGQTVAHHPDEGLTSQIGNLSRLAARTGLTVIGQFREGDLALGGEGAPLLPRYHAALVRRALGARGRGVAVHNLGGISNLTYFAPGGKIVAWDTGPANAWIDEAARSATHGRAQFDRDGRLAARGAPDEAAVARALKHPFFARRPPKSTGRDDFRPGGLAALTRARGPDLVRTALEITVRSIAAAYRREVLARGWPLRAIYLVGGGAANGFLRARLAEELPGTRIASIEELGADATTTEAEAFAIFGARALRGLAPGGEWTGLPRGARPPAPHLIPGANWMRVLGWARR